MDAKSNTARKQVVAPMLVEHRHPVPLWLTKAGAPVAAWLHRPTSATRQHFGVVLSSSIGIEALWGFVALLQWADALAANGIHCIRIDPPGFGDSDGSALDTGLVARWRAAFGEAADILREEGATDVVVGGVRVGALVAAAAAAPARSRQLLAWAPYSSGRAFTREVAAFDKMFTTSSYGPNDGAPKAPAGAVDGAGCRLGAEFVRELEDLNILDITFPADLRALIIPRDDVPGGSRFQDALAKAGAQATVQDTPGFAGAHDVPEQRTIPTAVFEASLHWLSEQFPRGTDQLPTLATVMSPHGPVAILRGAQDVDKSSEYEIRFGDKNRLVGMIAMPENGIVRGPGVVFLNPGLVHHVGPHRQWLEMARRWAALGIPSLRMDIGGIAGSLPPEGCSINRPYPPWAVADVAAGVASLRDVKGVPHEVVLIGLCAGAHNAFHAALELPGIRSIIMIDPITYYRKDSDPLNSAEWEAEWKTHAEYQWFTSRLSDPAAWKKLFAGQVDITFIAKILALKARAVASAYANVLLPAALATKLAGERGDLTGHLTKIVGNGTSVHLVFAGNAPGLWYLKMYGRRAVKKLPASGRFTLTVGDGADHTFSRWGWRQWLSDTTTKLLLEEAKRKI